MLLNIIIIELNPNNFHDNNEQP